MELTLSKKQLQLKNDIASKDIPEIYILALSSTHSNINGLPSILLKLVMLLNPKKNIFKLYIFKYFSSLLAQDNSYSLLLVQPNLPNICKKFSTIFDFNVSIVHPTIHPLYCLSLS